MSNNPSKTPMKLATEIYILNNQIKQIKTELEQIIAPLFKNSRLICIYSSSNVFGFSHTDSEWEKSSSSYYNINSSFVTTQTENETNTNNLGDDKKAIQKLNQVFNQVFPATLASQLLSITAQLEKKEIALKKIIDSFLGNNYSARCNLYKDSFLDILVWEKKTHASTVLKSKTPTSLLSKITISEELCENEIKEITEKLNILFGLKKP